MIEHFKRALILAPHTDDGEFGCGGTISKLLEHGCEVYYMAFSVCEQSVPYGFAEDELKTAEEDVQKITDKNVNEIDKILENKEKEIMSI